MHTSDGKSFIVVHRLLGKEKFVDKLIRKVVKCDFCDFIRSIYQKIDYRNSNDKNEYILLDIKQRSSLEDRFMFYFRYIDLFMGKKLSKKNGTRPSNYDRLSCFVDEYIDYFSKDDYLDIDALKNELNSLRNHFVHEGYYFSENKFKVTGKKREILYFKEMDYFWLYRIVRVLKLCSFLILYKEILSLAIDERQLKIALK